jgi:hypothetical protein
VLGVFVCCHHRDCMLAAHLTYAAAPHSSPDTENRLSVSDCVSPNSLCPASSFNLRPTGSLLHS